MNPKRRASPGSSSRPARKSSPLSTVAHPTAKMAVATSTVKMLRSRSRRPLVAPRGPAALP